MNNNEIREIIRKEVKEAQLNIYGKLFKKFTMAQVEDILEISADEVKQIFAQTVARNRGALSNKSSVLFSKYKEKFNNSYKHRYDNTAKAFEIIKEKDNINNYEVCFGFVAREDNKTFRRCTYIINRELEVIDVNAPIFCDVDDYDTLTYIPFISMDEEQFIGFTKDENGVNRDNNVLQEVFSVLEIEIHNKLIEEGYTRDKEDLKELINNIGKAIEEDESGFLKIIEGLII